jgi:hypothetical protein
MRAVEQWRAIEAGLDPGWDEVSLVFVAEDRPGLDAAAGVLGPLGAGRRGDTLRLTVPRRGGGPEKLANLLGRLDQKRIWGTLTLAGVGAPARATPAAQEAAVAARASAEVEPLVAAWDAAIDDLPPGWSDVLAELEVESTDFIPRAALLGSPLNPARGPRRNTLRFRASEGVGYGTSSGMVRRCLERMDAEGITGRVRVLEGAADTDNVYTQGPVWRIAGRSV